MKIAQKIAGFYFLPDNLFPNKLFSYLFAGALSVLLGIILIEDRLILFKLAAGILFCLFVSLPNRQKIYC